MWDKSCSVVDNVSTFLLLTDRYTSSERSFSSGRESIKSVRVMENPKSQTKDDLSNAGIAAEADPLDEETLELLDEKASTSKNNNLDLHQKIGDCWQIWSHDGFNKDLKKELLQKSSRKGNKRDKFFTAEQNTLRSELSALDTGLSILFRSRYEERERLKAMKYLLDAGKLLSVLLSNEQNKKGFCLSEFRSQG